MSVNLIDFNLIINNMCMLTVSVIILTNILMIMFFNVSNNVIVLVLIPR